MMHRVELGKQSVEDLKAQRSYSRKESGESWHFLNHNGEWSDPEADFSTPDIHLGAIPESSESEEGVFCPGSSFCSQRQRKEKSFSFDRLSHWVHCVLLLLFSIILFFDDNFFWCAVFQVICLTLSGVYYLFSRKFTNADSFLTAIPLTMIGQCMIIDFCFFSKTYIRRYTTQFLPVFCEIVTLPSIILHFAIFTHSKNEFLKLFLSLTIVLGIHELRFFRPKKRSIFVVIALLIFLHFQTFGDISTALEALTKLEDMNCIEQPFLGLTSTWGHCTQLCLPDSDCKAFSFNHAANSTFNCYLYRSCSHPKANQEWDLYLKRNG